MMIYGSLNGIERMGVGGCWTGRRGGISCGWFGQSELGGGKRRLKIVREIIIVIVNLTY